MADILNDGDKIWKVKVMGQDLPSGDPDVALHEFTSVYGQNKAVDIPGGAQLWFNNYTDGKLRERQKSRAVEMGVEKVDTFAVTKELLGVPTVIKEVHLDHDTSPNRIIMKVPRPHHVPTLVVIEK